MCAYPSRVYTWAVSKELNTLIGATFRMNSIHYFTSYCSMVCYWKYIHSFSNERLNLCDWLIWCIYLWDLYESQSQTLVSLMEDNEVIAHFISKFAIEILFSQNNLFQLNSNCIFFFSVNHTCTFCLFFLWSIGKRGRKELLFVFKL